VLAAVPRPRRLLVIAGTVASLLAWLVVQVPRYRHAGGERRQQLWTGSSAGSSRRRVQRVVDRRFNRSRYDAEAVVTAFTARLRQTVDLEAVRHDLLGVTDDAFKSAHVSVWLAPAPGPAPAPPR
jgi:hypothetical protein